MCVCFLGRSYEYIIQHSKQQNLQRLKRNCFISLYVNIYAGLLFNTRWQHRSTGSSLWLKCLPSFCELKFYFKIMHFEWWYLIYDVSVCCEQIPFITHSRDPGSFPGCATFQAIFHQFNDWGPANPNFNNTYYAKEKIKASELMLRSFFGAQSSRYLLSRQIRPTFYAQTAAPLLHQSSLSTFSTLTI